jgi:hypothetical protein
MVLDIWVDLNVLTNIFVSENVKQVSKWYSMMEGQIDSPLEPP